MPRWKANGWKTASKKPVANQDLWQRLDAAVAGTLCAGIGSKAMWQPLNERCDIWLIGSRGYYLAH